MNLPTLRQQLKCDKRSPWYFTVYKLTTNPRTDESLCDEDEQESGTRESENSNTTLSVTGAESGCDMRHRVSLISIYALGLAPGVLLW